MRHLEGNRWSWSRMLVLLLAQLWLAHAAVFFAHEYAHSFMAWALGWKSNPFPLHVPPVSATVLAIQLGIDQNVDEAAILASGHGVQAALVSGAGVLGNALITLPLGLIGFSYARRRSAAGWAMAAYWVLVASVGNLLDYIPVRTFTDGTDLLMDTFAVERGLGISPWTLLSVAGIPTLLITAWFFLRMEPKALRWLFPYSRGQRAVCALLTAFVIFCFYGAAGLSEGGPMSHRLSLFSISVAFPLTAIVSLLLVERNHSAATLKDGSRYA
ncbi:hypothetical protein [Terriglobus sp. TAA 43]|uniref:hypothetical protein n=1 Tax=Terriglobus sp. TAA 43 TaxID=278961 RepID=UPI0012ED4365|nr:hypothetical protein [Terriglobus sp. TAA 43]